MLRAMWTGTITFGLVKVPVKAYAAASQHDLKANQLHGTDGGRVTFNRVCQACGEQLEFRELVNGYPAGPDRFVVVSDADKTALMPETSTGFVIDAFCFTGEIEPALYESTYILAPDKGGAAGYSLVMRAMREGNVAGVGTVFMRGRAYLAALRSGDGCLLLSTLLYSDELLDASTIEAVRELKGEPDEKFLSVAAEIIERTRVEFRHAAYRDDFRDRLQTLIEARAAAGEFLAPAATTETSGDLEAALQASVAAIPKPRRKRSTAHAMAPSAVEPSRPRAKRVNQGTRVRLPQPEEPRQPELPGTDVK